MAQEYPDVVETSNFLFKSLQKVRLIDSNDVQCNKNEGRWLAVSSQLQIGVAVQGGANFYAFSTADVHRLAVHKQNINQEYTQLSKKVIQLHKQGTIVTIGVNCDGTLLGALVETDSGPFVFIYDARTFAINYQGDVIPTHEIRVCSNQAARGRAFEWNPAIADTFAASSDETTLVVVKVDRVKLSCFSMIGEKRFGAPVGVISWSPKGKQLTVGDDVGKVIQLKPELDIVRSTMPQTEMVSPRVVGLVWVATTEWVVAYGRPAEENIDIGILTMKKDKPITMHRLSDLQYGMKGALRSASLYGILLGEWNVIVSASAKLSEILLIGKEKDHWQTWQVDEQSRFDLPVAGSGEPAFPIGLAVDRSASQEIILSEDGSRRAPACPVVLSLTSDGVLASCHAVSLYPQHTSMQITPTGFDVSSVRIGSKPPTSLDSNSSDGTKSHSGVAPAGSSLFGGSLFGASTKAAPTNSGGLLAAAGLKPGSIFGGATAAVASASAPTFVAASAIAPPQSPTTDDAAKKKEQEAAAALAAEEAAKAKAAAAEKAFEEKKRLQAEEKKRLEAEEKKRLEAEEKKRLEAEEKARAESAARKALVEKRRSVKEKLETFERESTLLRVDNDRLQEALEQAKKTPLAEPVQAYLREMLAEIEKMSTEANGEQQMMVYLVKQLARRVGEHTAVIGGAESCSSALALLKQRDSFDRDERMKRLEERLADCKTKFAEAKKTLDTAKNMEKPTPLNAWSHVEVQSEARINEVLSRITLIAQNIRVKEDKLERDIRTIERQRKIDAAGSKHVAAKTVEREIPSCQPISFVPAKDVEAARNKLRVLCKARSAQVRRVPVPVQTLPSSHSKPQKSDLTRVQKLLEESLRLNESTSSVGENKPDVIKFSIGTQSPDPREVKPVTPAAVNSSSSARTVPPLTAAASTSPAARLSFTTTTKAASTPFLPQATSTPVRLTAPAIPSISMGTTAPVPHTPSIFGVGKSAEAKKELTVSKQEEGLKSYAESEKEKQKTEVSANATFTLKPASPVATSVVEEAAVLPVASPASTSSGAPSVEPKPVFSLTASTAKATPIVSLPSEVPVTAKESPSKPAFSFTPTSTNIATSSTAVTPTPPASTSNPAFSFAGTPAATTSETTAPSAKPAFSFAAAATAAAKETSAAPATTSSIFGGGASGVSTSVFGSAASTAGAASPSKTASIFGGGAPAADIKPTSIFGQAQSKPAGSIFGGGGGGTSIFGGGSSQAGAAGGVGFSFKKEENKTTVTTTPSAFNFKSGSSFAAAAAQAASASADDGMMEEAPSGGGGGGIFGGGGGGSGFLSGLGSSSSTGGGNKNVFGSGMNLSGSGQSAASSWLFKGSGGQQQPQQQTSSIFGGGGTNQQQASSTAFGGSPRFGGAPAFGSKPAFGSSSPSQSGSVFGGSAASSGGGFAAFAGKSAGFGGVAQPQQQQGGSIFGGSSSGGGPSGGGSIFGGSKPGSFSSWR